MFSGLIRRKVFWIPHYQMNLLTLLALGLPTREHVMSLLRSAALCLMVRAYDMIVALKDMFHTQARTERFNVAKYLVNAS